jgi:hypothetical protein
MHTIAIVVKQVLEREISGALPLPRLLKRVSAERQGHTGGLDVLLREIESRPEDFRVLHPYTGPWVARGPRFPPAVSPFPWILLRKTSDSTWRRNRAETVLMESLRQVGNFVDADSFTALARWLQLVLSAGEAGRFFHSTAMNHPERHSPSESTSTSENPAASVAA